MRMSNEAFEAEVRRRAAAYQQTERVRRKRILMTAGSLAACLVLAVGFGLSRSGWNLKSNTVSMETANKSNNADHAAAPSEKAAEAVQNDAVPQTEHKATKSVVPSAEDAQPSAAEDRRGEQDASYYSSENLSVRDSGSSTEEIPSDVAVGEAGTVLVTMDAQIVSADTDELKITLTNPGNEYVMIDTREFRLIYTDADGKETVMQPIPEAPDTLFPLGAGRTATLPVRVTQFTDRLTAGAYRMEFRGESVMFTVE